MMPFSLFLALKYLKPRRSFISVVTVISVLGVLLGVAILVIVLSVMTGFDNVWEEKILSFRPHLVVYSSFGRIDDEESLCQAIENVKGVKSAAPVVITRALVRGGGRAEAPLVVGVDPDRAHGVSKIAEHIRQGGSFDVNDDHVVVGIDLAAELGLSVGSKVLVYSPRNVVSKDEVYLPEELTVTGIFDMGLAKFDAGYILTSLDVARDLVGLGSGVHAIYVMTDDPLKFTNYGSAVARVSPPYCKVLSWRDEDAALFNALRTEKTMMFVLLVFITIVAIFCVTNTLIVITVQKTNEIGLLKALGFSSRRIMGVFIWHGWIQCIMGILAGVASGLLVLKNLTRMVRWLASFNLEVFPKEIYGLDEIPWQISSPEIVKIALIVMLFCTLSSLLPAWRAAKLDPVEALRHE